MTVRDLLARYDLLAYADAFEAEEIALADLAGLTDDELKTTVGMTSFPHCKRFKAAVAELVGSPATNPVTPLSGPTMQSASTSPPLSGPTATAPLRGPLSGPTMQSPSTSPPLPGPTTIPDAPPLLGQTPQAVNPISLEGATRGLTMAGRAVLASAVDLTALPPGTSFDGRYTIVDLLGRGGMGAVYQAVDTRVKQTVALKTLPSKDPGLLDALAREVALAQQLNHPNLLTVRHLETRGDAPYLVMELMDGGDLGEQLAAKGGKLGSAEAMRILDGVLSGLTALHSALTAHLDLKPGNVLLGKDGRIKLADFGISSRMRDQRGGGTGAGTPEYAPPEQMRGEPCDARADVYAAGILAHVLLTGRLPFEAGSLTKVRAWHDQGERRFPLVSATVGEVLARATAIRVDDRYRTADELRTALTHALTRRSWYALGDGVAAELAGRVASSVVVLETDRTVTPSEPLLSQGAAAPGWETVAGLVVLQAHPIAARYGGATLALTGPQAAAWEAGIAALRGKGDGLARLADQSATTEAALALALSLGGDANLALRRLALAESAAKTTADHLAVAQAVRAGVGRPEAAREALGRAERAAKGVRDHLDVAATARWQFDDRQAATRSLITAERMAKTAEEHLCVAQAHLALTGDERGVTAVLERYAEVSQHAAKALIAAVRVVGAQPGLRAWAARLEREAGSDESKLEALRAVYESLGDTESSGRSAAARTESLNRQFAALLKRLRVIGVAVPGAATPTPVSIAALATMVEGQERLHRIATELDRQAKAAGLPLARWDLPYREGVVEGRREVLEAQRRFVFQATEVDADRVGLGLTRAVWPVPGTPEAMAAAREETAEWAARTAQVEALCRTCHQTVGWAPAAPALPHGKEALAALRKQVEEQQGWHARVMKASGLGRFVSPPSARPLDERAVASYEAAVAQAAAMREMEVQAARAVRAKARDLWLRIVAAAVVLVAVVGEGWEVWSRHEAAERERVAAAERDRAEAAEAAERDRVAAEARAERDRVAAVAAAERDRVAAEHDRLAAAFLTTPAGTDATSPSVGPMKWIPAGTFTMGSPPSQAGRGADETEHRATLTHGFLLMEHEVTQGEWMGVMGSNPSRFTACGADCPVETVSWNEAVAFASRASARDGATYRLPTESEWEYAARGGGSGIYAGGIDVDAVAWMNDNAGGTTHAVCGKQRNGFGLCDMSGNVSEWTSDWYGVYPTGSVTDPVGASTGSNRVVRGGDWSGSATYASVAYRFSTTPDSARNDFGFRLSRSALAP